MMERNFEKNLVQEQKIIKHIQYCIFMKNLAKKKKLNFLFIN